MQPDARRRLGSSDVEVSALGFGGAALGNLYAPVSEAAACEAVERALALGIRYFDTAPYYGYGLSEERLGRALAGLDRSSFAVSTKVGRLLVERPGSPRDDQGFVDANCFDPVFDYSHDGVLRSFEASCRRLQLDRVEVLLLHDVGEQTHGRARSRELFEQAMGEGLHAMGRLREEGAVGAIGLGVNECAVCIEALERVDLDCLLLAGRYTLLEQGALDELLPLCSERGTSLIVGGPFNSGVLADAGGALGRYDYGEVPPAIRQRMEGLRKICADWQVPLGAVALQFPLLHPAVASVIPGARSAEEVETNADWLRLPVPAGLHADLVAAGLLRSDAPVGCGP